MAMCVGIHIDEKLTWKQHINVKSKQVSRTIGILNKLKNILPTTVLKTIYYSLIQSHLLYGLFVWGNDKIQNSRLGTLQKKAIRLISGKHY